MRLLGKKGPLNQEEKDKPHNNGKFK